MSLRVRGAILSLERIGFLERMPVSRRTHQATPDGLHRKPVLFMFGSDYGSLFIMANRRAQAARERRVKARRTQTPANPSRPSPGFPGAQRLNLPKSIRSEADRVLMGNLETALADLPVPIAPLPAFEAALNRFKKAFEEGRLR